MGKLFVVFLALGLTTAACAENKTINCPLRDEPLGIDSPLIDILLSKGGRDALENVSPGLIEKLPPFMTKSQAPSFGAIMSLEGMAEMGSLDVAQLPVIDDALKSVKLATEEKESRCARYDNESVVIEQSTAPLRVLIFEKVNGFVHEEAIPAARGLIEKLATQNEWSVVTTDKGGAISPENLSKVDVVVWNNISGDALTVGQRKAFRDWVENGGGFVGLHGAGGDSRYWWDWYAEELVGAQFIGHPMDPQFQETTVTLETSSVNLSAGVESEFLLTDEWYSFAKNPRDLGVSVVATIDESEYQTKGWGGADIAMGDDHPVAWTKCVGAGRSFYSAIGHQSSVYGDRNYSKLIENALLWTGGKSGSVCSNG